MPVDIDATVIANRRLSADYNVLALAAPEIAAAARPGQFVMIKTSGGQDPLLRRPFSIFEIIRDASGAPSGVSIFNKRIGAGTTLLSRVEAGTRLPLLGPLGRPFEDDVEVFEGDKNLAEGLVWIWLLSESHGAKE